jgi:hypothetical protein
MTNGCSVANIKNYINGCVHVVEIVVAFTVLPNKFDD